MRTLEQILRDLREAQKNLESTQARVDRYRDELRQLQELVNKVAA